MTNRFEILPWEELSEADKTSLLLGNGASVAVSRKFSYTSLFDVATGKNWLPSTLALFSRFGTTDFEHVLLACWYAELVNQELGNPSSKVSEAYREVKSALIQAVKETHPDHRAVVDTLKRTGVFASKFSTVVSLNYDLSLYWSMLLFNDEHGKWFKDGFVNQRFESGRDWLMRPHGSARGVTMVYYAHGSLVLARNVYGEEIKLSVASVQADLLGGITDTWDAKSHVPLFVSEGDSASKVAAIRRSRYLSSVYDGVLTDLGERVVVYGLSFSENDVHILDALKKRPPRLVAVSVFTGQEDSEQQAYCHEVAAQFRRRLPTTEVTFFDSNSPGCWGNPE